MQKQYQIGFWNLENLFDIEDAPAERRTEKVARAIEKDIKGWDQAMLDLKIGQLSSIIKQMNNGAGPDILGVCEVENEFVMNLLTQSAAMPGRNYKYVHHDSEDQRGIDIAFIYDDDLFDKGEVFDHFVMRRTATRDLLQVSFTTTHGNLIVIIGNHWPSRSGGAPAASAAYRAMAGETLAYFHQRIPEMTSPDVAVMALGDFNDEPFDQSLEQFGLSTRSLPKVTGARENPYFYNLMWPLMGKCRGTLYFESCPNIFDQIMVNKSLIAEGNPLKVLPDTAQIMDFPQMKTSAKNPAPKRFGGMGKAVNKKGYSDHYPVGVTVEENY